MGGAISEPLAAVDQPDLPSLSDLDVSIDFHATAVDANTRQYAVYLVHVKDATMDEEWVVYRRFSEFAALADRIYASGFSHVSSQSLPPKRIWGPHSSKFLQRRMNGLNAWIESVVMGCVAEALGTECEDVILHFLCENPNVEPHGFFKSEQDVGDVIVASPRASRSRASLPESVVVDENEEETVVIADAPEVDIEEDPNDRKTLSDIRGDACSTPEISEEDAEGVYPNFISVKGEARSKSFSERVKFGVGNFLSSLASATPSPGPGPSASKSKVNGYEMLKLLGKGSFAKVYMVKKDNQVFALKVLKKAVVEERRQVEHTRTERDVLSYVEHPFIVTLHAAFQTKSRLFLVLDYCAGGELFFHLGREGKFSKSRTTFYTAEIVLALTHVHSLGVIYRDLKPENVLLSREGHIKLADFGLSKENVHEELDGARSICGTPEYVAPEILMGKGYGRMVDYYSLGALVFEMITGLPPFYCRDKRKMFERIKSGILDVPSSMDEDSKQLVVGLLRRDPSARLSSSHLKAHAFFKDLDWEAMVNLELEPPYVPQLDDDADTSLFDIQFTDEPVHVDALETPETKMFHSSQTRKKKDDDKWRSFTFERDDS